MNRYFSITSLLSSLFIITVATVQSNEASQCTNSWAQQFFYKDAMIVSLWGQLGLSQGWRNGQRMEQKDVERFLMHFGDKQSAAKSNNDAAIPLMRKRSQAVSENNPENNGEEKLLATSPEQGETWIKYRENSGKLIGLLPCQNVWIFDVCWQDEKGQRPLLIENKSTETLFIDPNPNIHHLTSVKKLFGVRAGHARVVPCNLRTKACVIWREQKEQRRIRDLTTIVQLAPRTAKVTVHQLSRGLRIELS